MAYTTVAPTKDDRIREYINQLAPHLFDYLNKILMPQFFPEWSPEGSDSDNPEMLEAWHKVRLELQEFILLRLALDCPEELQRRIQYLFDEGGPRAPVHLPKTE